MVSSSLFQSLRSSSVFSVFKPLNFKLIPPPPPALPFLPWSSFTPESSWEGLSFNCVSPSSLILTLSLILSGSHSLSLYYPPPPLSLSPVQLSLLSDTTFNLWWVSLFRLCLSLRSPPPTRTDFCCVLKSSGCASSLFPLHTESPPPRPTLRSLVPNTGRVCRPNQMSISPLVVCSFTTLHRVKLPAVCVSVCESYS